MSSSYYLVPRVSMVVWTCLLGREREKERKSKWKEKVEIDLKGFLAGIETEPVEILVVFRAGATKEYTLYPNSSLPW